MIEGRLCPAKKSVERSNIKIVTIRIDLPDIDDKLFLTFDVANLAEEVEQSIVEELGAYSARSNELENQ